MKYTLVNSEIQKDFVKSLLTIRGIKDVEAFLNPTKEMLQDPEDLERVLQEEPETFLDMLYPYPGEYFVEEIYQDKNLIYSA